MKGYKGFSPGLICHGKQYAENTVFEEDSAVICSSGMHFCENPFDVLDYYPFVNNNSELNEFAEVEALDEVKTDDNKKYCTKKLRIGAKIGIAGLVSAFVYFTLSKLDRSTEAAINTGNYSAAINTDDYSAAINTDDRSAAINTGDRSAAINTGNYSAAINTDDRSAAINTGDRSAAINTGNYSAAINTGNYSASIDTGNYSAAINTGNYSASIDTGNYSAAINTGYRSASIDTGNYSAATNTGDRSAATVEGQNSFAIATGIKGKARGKRGCYIAIAEWVLVDGERKIKAFKTAKVDGKRIKEDTFYTLKDGKFVEAD